VKAKVVTLAAVFAATYAAVSLLPGFPILGLSGSEIDFARSLEIGYGLILGPALGPSSAFLGAVVGKLITGDSIGLLFTPLAIVSSFVAASLNRYTLFRMKGWLVSSLPLGLLIVAWYLTPVGEGAPFYAIPHLAGLAIVLLFRGRITDNLQSQDRKKLALGVLLSSYPATMAGQMLGSTIFVILLNPVPSFFIAVLPITIAERIILTILSTIIGVPLVLAARSMSFIQVNGARSSTTVKN
jgi:hypothetical protein